MQAKERLYVWLRQATFNEEDGCRHPQDVLAIALGVTERTIIRATKELEAEGRIRVNRPRKRGQCNTYWVDCWNPSRRSGVLNILRQIRPEVEQRRTQKQFKERARIARFARRYEVACHPKRTAMPTRQLSRSLLLPLSLKAVKELVRSRGGASNRVLLTGRNEVLGQDELVCRRCQEVEAQVSELKLALEATSAENTELGFELAGARHTQRMLERQAAKARDEGRQAAKESPKAEAIRSVLEHWRQSCGHPKANVDSDGTRWKLTDKMIRKYDFDTLADAVSFVAVCPFLIFGNRKVSGGRENRKSQLEHCIGTEARVEQNSAGWRRMSRDIKKEVQQIEADWREVNATEQVMARLWMDALAAMEAGVEPGEPLEQFLRDRRAGYWDGMKEGK